MLLRGLPSAGSATRTPSRNKRDYWAENSQDSVTHMLRTRMLSLTLPAHMTTLYYYGDNSGSDVTNPSKETR